MCMDNIISETRRRSSPSTCKSRDRASLGFPHFRHKRFVFGSMRRSKVLAAGLLALPVLVTLSFIFRHQPSHKHFGFAEARILGRLAPNASATSSEEDYSPPMPELKLLDGLLAPEFDQPSCLSRYESFTYRKESPHKPSSYLVSKLRSYEALHKRCGPHTKPYNQSIHQMLSGKEVSSGTDCKYIVWICYSGLGNRILTLVSAFLYALLTDRVLLVDPGIDMPDLLCEPFPEKSWFLPHDFPLKNQFGIFYQNYSNSYGNILRTKSRNTSSESSVPPFLYTHLAHDYNDHDKLFFCDEEQEFLHKVPWLIVRTDNYFVPFLFLIPSFERELVRLFPDKETIFHHLGRYLVHPSNHVWGLVRRYYDSYLGRADERVGIQIRIFDDGVGPFEYVMNQILACTRNQKLLPELYKQEGLTKPGKSRPKKHKHKAVLVTSLLVGYSEKLRNMYWEHNTANGDVVSVHQPSHEEHQNSQDSMHNRKALAEIHLLSLCDVLVTSSWSTFGYVAQGLGGLRPWIMYKPENRTSPDPPCARAMSMEPCFHSPPFYDCKARKGADTGRVVPHVRHCEDVSWGLKVVHGHDEV